MKGGERMDITIFAQEIAKLEGGKEQVNIAQIGQILRIVKDLLVEKTGVDIYEVIRKA